MLPGPTCIGSLRRQVSQIQGGCKLISDSPYDSGELVLKPGTGVASGVCAALLMLALIQVLSPVSELSPNRALAQIGSLAAPADAPQSSLILTGLAIHLSIAGPLGFLYALSQRRIPHRGLVGVGVLFGFVAWVISTVIIGWLFDESLRAILRSWPWLLASLLFGLVLASVSVWQMGIARCRSARQQCEISGLRHILGSVPQLP